MRIVYWWHILRTIIHQDLCPLELIPSSQGGCKFSYTIFNTFSQGNEGIRNRFVSQIVWGKKAAFINISFNTEERNSRKWWFLHLLLDILDHLSLYWLHPSDLSIETWLLPPPLLQTVPVLITLDKHSSLILNVAWKTKPWRSQTELLYSRSECTSPLLHLAARSIDFVSDSWTSC